jgi:YD repeat-containing protein
VDAQLRSDIEAATRAGVPYSRFRGDERSEATTYEYDPDGRLTRSVTVREPEWTDDDRAFLLALLEEERETCPICGHPLALCRDPRTERKWTVVTEICQPGRVAQATAENEQGTRGLAIYTRLTEG